VVAGRPPRPVCIEPSGPYDLFEKDASGSGTEQLVLASTEDKKPEDWFPGGDLVLYTSRNERGENLWILPLSGDRKPYPIAQTSFEERNGQFAPDGRWIAYDSNESGRFEVYAQPFPGLGGKWQISAGGGVTPRWSHDGREVFYIAPDGVLVAVPVRISPNGQALEPGVPDRLFVVPIGALRGQQAAVRCCPGQPALPDEHQSGRRDRVA